MNAAVLDRADGDAIGRRLHAPACVFLIVYGVAKLAELADWSRLHGDVAAMLDVGSGTVTGLLIAGKGAELALTALAVLALIRRGGALLLAALAGWTADLALLTIVAGSSGDRGRLLEHGVAFVAFAGLLVVTYVFGGVRLRRADAAATKPHETLRDAPDPGATRQDLPVRPSVTRQDLHVRRPEVTRQDLHVRKPPEPPRDR